MTLQQLGYVAKVVESGSINRAAKRMFVSQSSISSALLELEEELGVAIFSRNNKGVSLTEEGERFFESVLPILEQERRVLARYADRKTSSTQNLRVASQHYPFAVEAFARLIGSMEGARYSLQIKETHLHVIIDDVASGESELGVLFFSRATKQFIVRLFEHRDLEFHPLASVTPHVYLREGHPLAGSASLDIAALRPYPYAFFIMDRSASYHFSEEVVLDSFELPESTIRVNDRATMYNVLAHTDAFSIGSGFLGKGFSDAAIISVPLSSFADEMQLGWIRQKNRATSPAAQTYIALLEKSIREHQAQM